MYVHVPIYVFSTQWGTFQNKNVDVTTIKFLMSGDLTGLCLYIHLTGSVTPEQVGVNKTSFKRLL